MKRVKESWIPLLYIAALAFLLLYGGAPRTLTATDGESYQVTVTYDAAARIPAGSTLEAEELSGERYEDYYARAVSETGGFARMRAFDLRCVAPDGSEIEPCAPVRVSFRLAGSREAAERARVLHFIDGGGVVAPPAPANGAASDGYYTLDFETDSFSVYATLEGILKRTLTASDGRDYQVTAEYDDAAGIPDDAELSVSEIKEGDALYEGYVAKAAETLGTAADSVRFARAFDIALRNPLTGAEYQPDETVQVSIELLNDDLTRYDNVEVVHIHGEFAELMDCELRGEAVAFDTDGFSVYVLIGSEEQTVVPRWTYTFYVPSGEEYTEYYFKDENGNPVSKQTIKSGDSLIIPRLASEDENKVFAGWYQGSIVETEEQSTRVQLEETPYNFDDIDITEDSAIDLYAVYKEYVRVTFHGQYDSASGTFPIVRALSAELAETEDGKSASVNIADISAAYNSGDDDTGAFAQMAFCGWSLTPITTPGAATDDKGISVTPVADNLTVKENVDLYPIYKDINWLIYYAAQSGLSAAYVPPASYFAGEDGLPALPTTSRNGYTFKGWYTGTLNVSTKTEVVNGETKTRTIETVDYDRQITDAAGKIVADAGDYGTFTITGKLHLSADTTLYAKWEASYRIVYWKQNASKTPETENKTYEYDKTVTKAAEIGATVSVAPEDVPGDLYDGYVLGRYDTQDGSPVEIQNTKELTVLNAYYDLAAAHTPSGQTHTLTFADSVTGEGASANLPPEVELDYGDALSERVPDDPTSGRTSDSGKAIYNFSGWYMDADCAIKADMKTMTMPDHDLTLYAGWTPIKYLVQIDPDYGALYAYDDDGKLQGSGATYFNNTYDDDPISEYTHVTRDYVKSSSGTWFYVNRDLAYHDDDNRQTFYTRNPGEATEDTTFEYVPGAYTYAGWYEAYADGSEADAPYDFTQRTDHPTTLKLHWKRNGSYYLSYDAGEDGAMDAAGTTKSVLLDDIYADRADITLTRSAFAPDGYAFVGWRDAAGRVYAPGETFTLRADDAVRVGGKEIVTLEAVYVRATVARVVYDANGGGFGEEGFDYGSIPGETPKPVDGIVNEDAKTVTVSLDNNSEFTLSKGGFVRDGFTFEGWSHEPDYAPGDTLYKAGGTYGVDALEPTTLYAVWQTTVMYHLNPPEGGAGWGGEWDTETYTYHDGDDACYSQTVYLNNTVSEPPYIPVTSADNLMYRYWTTKPNDDATGYDFTRPVTAPLDLYAYWSAPRTIQAYAVDASAATLEDKTDADGWTVDSIDVGTTAIELSGDYVDAPEGYAFAFAAAATDMQTISDRNAVSEIRYDSVKKSVCVKYEGATDFTPLDDGYSIYFVYYRTKKLDILYKSMGANGILQNVTVPESAHTETDSALGGYDVAEKLAPTALYGYSHYAFAIGDANATDANGLSMMTDAVALTGTAAPPTLTVRNGWRGFEYSTGDAAGWVNCGYAPTLYVVYYKEIPTVVMFHEKTVGSSDVMATEFIYNYLVTETKSVLRKAGDEWRVDSVLSTKTVYDTTESTETAPNGTSYALKNGEANSAILFYSETPEETIEVNGESVTRKTVTAQSVTITQTPNPDFTTRIDGTVPENPEQLQYVYTANGSGGTQSVTFTNTHKAMTVEVHVAVVESDGGNGGIIRRDARRSDAPEHYSFAVGLGQSGNLLESLPSSDVFQTDTEYAFGAVMYGSGANQDGEAVNVAGMNAASVAYERLGESDVYELFLKDGAGNTLGQLGRNELYYLYYPMPQIRYVREKPDGTLSDISGHRSESDTESDAPITYGGNPLRMNGQTVAQKQRFEIPMTGFVISQSGNNFRMPAILDDGEFEHYLSYVKIGAGNAAAASLNDLDGVSEGRSMRLEVRDNTLRYSFDGKTWKPLPLSGTPTIYAIYDERGYDLQISKNVEVTDVAESDDRTLFTNASFTVKLTSVAITKNRYEAEGMDGDSVSATPASGETPGFIVLTVKDGTKIKIKGLGRGEYAITEDGNENYVLTAKTGRILGGSDSDMEVTENRSVSLTLGAETKVEFTNTPKKLCRIGDNVFHTFRSAIKHIIDNISAATTIEMLNDYAMPPEDEAEIPNGFQVTLTTAASGFDGAGTLAVITRGTRLTGAPLFVNKGTLTFRNVILDGQSVEASAPLIRSEGDLTIDAGTTLRNAFSSGKGGAISATAGNLTISSGVLTGNRATDGGAVYYSGSGVVTLSETGRIENNAATTGDGGAIYAESGEIDVTGTAAFISHNSAENGRGGAIYAENVVIAIDRNGGLTGNTARDGGAIYAQRSVITVSMTEDTAPSVTGNAATNGDGGAIRIGAGSVTVSGGAVSNNKAESGKGGAIYADGATVTLSGTGEIKSNVSVDGGAIYANTGAVTVSGGALEGNTATTGGGGAIYAGRGGVTVSGGTVKSNKATSGDGGAIYADAGAVTLSGITLSENRAGRDGGAVYAGNGAVTMSATFTLTQNTAGRHGGAFYLDSGSATLGDAVTMTQNKAVNGAAIFVASGRAAFNGGGYTNNTASDGGAVGVGSASARLTFQNNVQIKDNVGKDAAKSNVYLNQDSDSVLNMAGLGNNAAIGVYVPDSMTKERGVPGARFASYTSESNVAKITNDRYGFNIQKDTDAKKLFWGKSVKVEVHYWNNDNPPLADETKYNPQDYYPEFGSAAISELAAELYNKYNVSTMKLPDGAAYAGAYVDGIYMTRLEWNSAEAKWKLVKLDGTETELSDKTIVIYYAQPAYLSIENNTDMTLNITSLNVGSVINTPAFHKLVFAKNGFIIQEGLLPVTAEDLRLKAGTSISLLIPGGQGMAYALAGKFTTDAGGTVQLRRTSGSALSNESVSTDGFTLDGTTLNSAATYEIIFGENRDVCKITVGGEELLFGKISDAVAYIKTNNINPAVIEMLTDYLIPLTDAVEIPKGFDITLTTATDYEGEGGRATISRNADNEGSMIKADTGSINSFLTLRNLIIDGKSVQGSSNGGAVSMQGFGVTVDHVDFLNVYAGSGGALFVQTTNGWRNSSVTVSYSNFYNCRSTLSGGREGGGAIHAYVDNFEVSHCIFDSCTADWQAGAVFHRVDKDTASIGKASYCTFVNCTSKAAGGLEIDARTIEVESCFFDNCSATERNGGAFNTYSYDQASPTGNSLTMTGCTFNNCRLTGNNRGKGGNGGGVRSNAQVTLIQDCTFTNTSTTHTSTKTYGGAISISSDNATKAEIYGCTIEGCSSNNGGGIYAKARELIIGDYSDGQRTRPTIIRNCVSRTEGGGGVLHENKNSSASLTIQNSVISGNTVSANGKPGGGVYTIAKTVTVSGSDISGNTSKGGGGGLYSNALKLSLTNSTISGNETQDSSGGGVWYDDESNEGANRNSMTLTVKGCTMDGNKASNGSGGGIYTLVKTVTVEDTTISNCEAKIGGGVYHDRNVDGSALTLTGSRVNGCKASSGNGGGVYANARTVTLTGATLSGNRASASGGGIYRDIGEEGEHDLIFDASQVTGNTASTGGGVYAKSKLTFRNGVKITGNNLSNNIPDNVAGVFIEDGLTLSLGSKGKDADTVIVRDNKASNGAASNLRLWANSDGQNNTQSVYVWCSLGRPSEIGVVNANKAGTWFGSSKIGNPGGFSDSYSVFKADNSTLHGIIDRMDTTYKTIIWAGEPVAKITDKDGNLLYLKTDGQYPAIFDRLYEYDESDEYAYNTKGAFNVFNAEELELYTADGDPYTGTSYRVKMLVERFETAKEINVKHYEGREITFTTAGGRDADYPYVRASGGRATVIRGAGVDSAKSLINVSGNLTLDNIIIDGGSENGITAGENTRCMRIEDENASVTLGLNAYLLNGKTTGNGGGVYVESGALEINGGTIRDCVAVNGGAVYKLGEQDLTLKGGSVSNCEASKGGGVYLDGGKFDMSGGTISNGKADEGGGVYVADGKSLYMSGGFILRNKATEKGGGIAIGGINAKLFFSGKVTVSGNTFAGTGDKCNVELDENSKEVINTSGTGLLAGSSIGVYVPGNRDDENEENETNPYRDHGGEHDPFGTFAANDPATKLFGFINDRNGLKGGLIANPDSNTIYWVRIFSLRVEKTLVAGHDATENDLDASFQFTVDITTGKAQSKAGDISGEYGAMNFGRQGDNATRAIVSMKPGENVTGENLPDGLSYTVTENIEPEKKYAVIPTSSRHAGAIGENNTPENRNKPGVDPYTSVASFINILPVCKITDAGGNLLYRNYTLNGVTYSSVPAVYTELYGDDGAFAALQATTFYKSDNTPYNVSDGVQIQMLIPEYTLTKPLTVSVPVTLTTAKTNDAKFPYRGTGGAATIKRAYGDADGGSLFTVAANGNLTLNNITLDGAKASYTCGFDGGLVNVAANGTLNIGSGATLTNSKTRAGKKGGAVYVANGGSVAMSGGAVTKNASVGDGAGVYLEQGAKLYLSGNPNFGGTGVDVGDNIVVGNGNYKEGAIDSTNGGKTYKRARQDIYLAEADSVTASIVLKGKLTGYAGSIWVWAENARHYKTKTPFATADVAVDEDTCHIFRNAQTDNLTGVKVGKQTYLTGIQKEDKTDKLIYWGWLVETFDFDFQKKDGSGQPQKNAQFTLYTDKECKQASDVDPVVSDADGKVSFAEVPADTYYMRETVVPAGYVNGNTYLVLVGEDALNDAKSSGVLANEDYGSADVHIFLFSDDKAVTTPDIAAYGILNISEKIRTVILRKVGENGSNYIALKDAQFDILRYDMVVVASGAKSSDNGLFWVGELAHGKYYLRETTVPDGYKKLSDGYMWFDLTVDETGVSCKAREAPPTAP